jgi:30S ribosomal protein S31
MGKGDKKTPKGKRFAGSHGNARPKAATKTATVKAPVAAKTVVTKKAPAKKAATKKA